MQQQEKGKMEKRNRKAMFKLPADGLLLFESSYPWEKWLLLHMWAKGHDRMQRKRGWQMSTGAW